MPSKTKGDVSPSPNVTVPPVGPQEDLWDRHIDHVLSELRRLYAQRIEPAEKRYDYDVFKPSWFSETIKQKKPFITFLGPFSSGKSTFVNYLMQNNYLLTGPQPVTDKFTVIMYGDTVQQIPGRVLLADARQPFRGLSQFGDAFAESFNGILAPHPILRFVSLIDTPGVLEAAGDMHARRYDYVKVCRWFVEKSDLVFVLFDPTKLDAGAELRMLFKNALPGHESKIRIVLNKADTVRPMELMRVYGALFWNLSNLINTTEPPRVFISSFWDRPYQPNTDHKLFTQEKEDLLYELIETVPLQSLDRRVTSVLRRASDVLIFILVCATYRSRLPAVFGKAKAKAAFYAQYPMIAKDLAARYRLSEKDFPSCEEVRAFLTKVDSHEFPNLEKVTKMGWITSLKKTIDQDLPLLLVPIQQHSVLDPRDRKNSIMLEREYAQQMTNQLAGREGIQGALGQQRPLHAASLANAEVAQTAPQHAPQSPPPPQAPPQPQASPMSVQPSDQTQQMAAMMQMMQQMMMSSSPPPSRASSERVLPIECSPEQLQQQQQQQQMMAMMAMMQQMQNGVHQNPTQ